jgi:hypothetical protein
METGMTRRKKILMAVLGATILGFAGLAAFGGHNGIFADDDDDDDGQEALIRTPGPAHAK